MHNTDSISSPGFATLGVPRGLIMDRVCKGLCPKGVSNIALLFSVFHNCLGFSVEFARLAYLEGERVFTS